MKYDIVGDIHGCFEELLHLLGTLGFEQTSDGTLKHPENRKLVFLGDLTDRGPNSVAVLQFVTQLVKQKKALYTPGNHCNKLYRYFLGHHVQKTNGLETTVAELQRLSTKERSCIRTQFLSLYDAASLYLTLAKGQLIVAHAGIKRKWIGTMNKRIKTFVLYGDITGEKEKDGRPIRRDWAQHDIGNSWVVYGHTPVQTPRFINKTVNIDTGCVFGGKLTAFRYPELTTVSVPSQQPFLPDKFRTFED